MIFRIAIRDISKSWKRSAAVVSAVAISVFLLEFGAGYMDGFRDKIYKQVIRESGHLRITARGYDKRMDLLPLTPNIEYRSGLADSLATLTGVIMIRPMLHAGALANSVDRTLEMQVIGSTPASLKSLYQRLDNSMVQGHLPDGANQIAIGGEAARLLNVSVGDKIILLTNDVYGGMSAVEPEISGIYRSLNDEENSLIVLAELSTVQKLLALDNRVTEIKIELDSHENVDQAATAVKAALSDAYEVKTWREYQAGLIAMLEISDIFIKILAGIILMVAALGMINTFLISVLERMADFGTLRAIGLRATQLVWMVVAQGTILGIIGTIIGLLFSVPIVLYFQFHPVDFGEAMQSMQGMDSLIWMYFSWGTMSWIAALGIAIAILASFYPAVYAGRKRPVDVLRNLI